MKKSITYNFDVDDATQYGVEAAVLLSNIRFWVFANKAKERNLKDGKFWTYNSARTLTNLYPFWSRRKIARLLVHLEKAEAIESACFNDDGYDQTKWYTIAQKSSNEHTDAHNGQQRTTPLVKSVQTPLVKSDQCALVKTVQSSIQIKTTDKKPIKKQVSAFEMFPEVLKENLEFCLAWDQWVSYRADMRKPISKIAYSRFIKKLEKFSPQQCIDAIDDAIQSNWTGLFPQTDKPKAKKINDGENIDSLM